MRSDPAHSRPPRGTPTAGESTEHAGGEIAAGLTAAALWPAVQRETLPWKSSYPPDLLSRSVRAQLEEPYEAAITPGIADLEVRLPRATASAAEDASKLIREFDTEVGGELAPVAAILLRTESASSSEIDNLTSGAKQVALAELGEDARANATQIVGNVEAMRAAISLSAELSAESILAMHRALVERFEPDSAGRWRREQVWIGGGRISPTTRRSFRHAPTGSPAPSTTWWHSPTGTTSRRSPTPPSHTPSSRPSTRSGTATVAPGGP